MKTSIAAFVSRLPENIAVDCAVSAVLVVGCAVIGFLGRSMVVDLQANLLLLS